MKEDAKELKKEVSILRYLNQTNKQGKNFPCPLHKDKKPSAKVYENIEGDYFVCYSCGFRGDVFALVREKEGKLDFISQLNFIKENYERFTK